MGKTYQLENDHIFPYSRLKKAGYGHENRIKYALAQEFTNRAILTQVANRTKSDKQADVYLSSVQKKFPNALELQSIPSNPDLWRIENYEIFSCCATEDAGFRVEYLFGRDCGLR